MTTRWNRREVLGQLAAASAALLLPRTSASAERSRLLSPENCEISLSAVSPVTIRLTISPVAHSQPAAVPDNGSLVPSANGAVFAKFRANAASESFDAGHLKIQFSPEPLQFRITDAHGQAIQQISIDKESGEVSFTTGDAPLLGLGEGGPQFDRRGSTDRMRSGQGGYQLGTHGGRVPIPWLIGTSGWALFFNHPYGTFDFTGPQSKFLPKTTESALPLDIFLVASADPAVLMAEYARLTGHAELPPLWSFGYQQSHRTLASREEVLGEAKTFREKKLPCDALIYLSTGFCPSGWNTENGSFVWNSRVFPDPKVMLDELHKDNFKAVVHTVILSDKLQGSVYDRCDLARFDEAQASCYWNAHRKDFALGVDGWWPDEGDPLESASMLNRNRFYWEGPQIDRPNERPYALHRNGYAGMQRYASFLWSGDVYSKWETLKTHIPIAINTALTGIPYWGTDIGGFVPTAEFTAELYLRWFQFGAFNTLFRSHGRTWKLRLPWGWNLGTAEPVEINNYNGAGTPDASQLHNAQVEIICRKYLNLRYQLLPYLYSAAHECSKTGMPILRSLWLHYPDDPKAVACGDVYLWGRNILVAPVVEKGATERRLYLPAGDWYDFWTHEKIAGGREITRPVDLETMPLYLRAGSILPLGPVKQFVSEKVDAPFTITIYPGADATFLLYEDDGSSFAYRQGEYSAIQLRWNDKTHAISLDLAEGSRMLQPGPRPIEIKLANATRPVTFTGKPLEIKFETL